MASLAVSGLGVEFRRWDHTSGVWEKLAEVSKVDGPSMKRDTIDVTSLDSVNGYREFIASLRDAGEIKLDMIFRRDTYDLIKADFESDVMGHYEIIIPDLENTTFDFSGLVIDCPVTMPMDDKIAFTVTIKISGDVDVASGSESASPG